jgi:hypothetical protein
LADLAAKSVKMEKGAKSAPRTVDTDCQ